MRRPDLDRLIRREGDAKIADKLKLVYLFTNGIRGLPWPFAFLAGAALAGNPTFECLATQAKMMVLLDTAGDS